MKQFFALETTDRFLKEAIRGAGFKFNDCIPEFIDNSLDAGAKNIKITAIKNKKNLYDIKIDDDGKGIPHQDIYYILKQIGYGNLNRYKPSSISKFGLGMKYALVNLNPGGDVEICSIHNGYKSTVFFNCDDMPKITQPFVEKTELHSSTSIYIPNVDVSSNQISSMIKTIGCIYFPHIHNGNELNITVFHNEKEINIEFTDPLYRNVDTDIQKSDPDCEINGYNVPIKGRYFEISFPDDKISSWDKQQGGTSFSASRSGIYFRLGGRYITLGNGNFYKPSDQQARNRIRIEVELDRDLMDLFGVEFNKSRISLDRNEEKLKNFISKIDEIVTWGVKNYQNNRSKENSLDVDATEERERLNKEINQIRRKNPYDIQDLPERPESTKDSINKSDDSKDKKSKNRPSIGSYNKEMVDIKVISKGTFNRLFEYYRESNKLIIEYNSDHNLYKYYKILNKESKKLVDLMIMAISDSLDDTRRQYIYDENIDNINDDIINTLSQRLHKYTNL